MKKYLLALVAIVLPLFASAQVQTWKNDPAHSRMGFSIKHLAVSEVSGFLLILQQLLHTVKLIIRI